MVYLYQICADMPHF